jgi:hypothetical protein
VVDRRGLGVLKGSTAKFHSKGVYGQGGFGKGGLGGAAPVGGDKGGVPFKPPPPHTNHKFHATEPKTVK